jgi:hypothetical protein
MWGPAGGAEAVVQQLHAGRFAVPQISMPLGTLLPALPDLAEPYARPTRPDS